MDDFVHPASLPPFELRKVIIRTHRLGRNWLSKGPSAVAAPTTVSLPLAIRVPELHCCASFYVSERAILIPTRKGFLIGFNPKTGGIIGVYDMKLKHGIYTLHAHIPSKSIYAIIAEPTKTE